MPSAGAGRGAWCSSEITPHHVAELALRFEDELAHLPRGTVPRGSRGNVVHAPAYILGRLVRRTGEAAARQDRQVDDVIAHISHRRLLQLERPQHVREGGELVIGALYDVPDAELLGAFLDRLRLASADDGGIETRHAQQMDAVAVEGVEGLQLLAARPVPQSAVRQYAVDVEDDEAHALGPRERIGG